MSFIPRQIILGFEPLSPPREPMNPYKLNAIPLFPRAMPGAALDLPTTTQPVYKKPLLYKPPTPTEKRMVVLSINEQNALKERQRRL